MTERLMRIAARAGILLTALCMLPGCAALPVSAQPVSPSAHVLDAPSATVSPTPVPTPSPTPEPAPTPGPTATPEPTPVYATIGAVGDIMIMQSQVGGAWNEETQVYDFTPSFRAMQGYFQNADLLCGNIETPVAGKDAGYSGPAPEMPTPGPDGTLPPKDRQTFNAPDELASSLFRAGFDVATTANNHCLDRGANGMVRTAEVLRAVGLTQMGTYTSEEDRLTPRVVDVNGIHVGLLAWTFSVNGNEDMLNSGQRGYAVGRTRDKAGMQEDIRLCKEAGAEFLVAFAHWDTEFSQTPDSSTRRLAKWMLEQGVDAVIGSHPHVVQPAEYVTVQRGDHEYTGIVVYSMGNCVSNMSPSPRDYGLYVQLTLMKRPAGVVELSGAGLLPLYCCKHRVEGRTLHEVLPAEEDAAAVAEAFGADSGDLMKARAHVLSVCGDAVKPLTMEYQMEDQAENQAKGEPYEG